MDPLVPEVALLLWVAMAHLDLVALVVLVQHQTFLVLASPAQAAVVAGYT
jgi:hypothetical protein